MNNGDTLDRTTLSLPLALSGGAQATLGDYAGHWLVLYFYPKDSTRAVPPKASTSTRCCRNSRRPARSCWASRVIR